MVYKKWKENTANQNSGKKKSTKILGNIMCLKARCYEDEILSLIQYQVQVLQPRGKQFSLLIPGFWSMRQLEIDLFPPQWKDSLQQVAPQHNFEFLITSYLIHVYLKRSTWLTLWAWPRLHLLIGWLVKRPQNKGALLTVILHHTELRKDSSATGDHTTSSD